MDDPIWVPDPAKAADVRLSRFIAAVGARMGRPDLSYDELYRLSIADPGWFWSELWDFAGVVGDKGSPPYLVDAGKMPGARFFPEARLNYAENALRGEADKDALVFWGEDRLKARMTWGELRSAVAKAQALLREAGVGIGDRVAAMLPNTPEAVVGGLAAASIGAVWTSCSPDFGTQGVVDRFGQTEPKVLIVADGYYYNGKVIDNAAKTLEIADALTTVQQILVVSFLGRGAELVEQLKARGRRADLWSRAMERPEEVPTFERLPFDHPLYILFSSGTTGVPKCIVHSAGGILLKHICEQQLHCDLRPGDRMFYFTTVSWMMWNWLTSGLLSGATLLLYDGAPLLSSGDILFRFAAEERCTHFGTSAKFIDALKKAEMSPRTAYDLSPLRSVLSTGSPLSPEGFDYILSEIKPDVHLASVSGGTDICGCFVLGNPLKPVFRGEIQGPALGLATDVVDDEGNTLRQGKGELVCRNAFPSMPLGFLNDAGGARYRNAYFERFPGMWHHGDFAEWTGNGGMIIHGRSDATLNPGGVRIGTAEIYRQVEQLPEIRESVVIGQDVKGDVRVVLFVVLQPGFSLDDNLREHIRSQIRQGATPRHVPSKILAVPDIPRTKSGKISEIAVRDVIMGRDIKNKEALANPQALEAFRDIDELRA